MNCTELHSDISILKSLLIYYEQLLEKTNSSGLKSPDFTAASTNLSDKIDSTLEKYLPDFIAKNPEIQNKNGEYYEIDLTLQGISAICRINDNSCIIIGEEEREDFDYDTGYPKNYFENVIYRVDISSDNSVHTEEIDLYQGDLCPELANGSIYTSLPDGRILYGSKSQIDSLKIIDFEHQTVQTLESDGLLRKNTQSMTALPNGDFFVVNSHENPDIFYLDQQNHPHRKAIPESFLSEISLEHSDIIQASYHQSSGHLFILTEDKYHSDKAFYRVYQASINSANELQINSEFSLGGISEPYYPGILMLTPNNVFLMDPDGNSLSSADIDLDGNIQGPHNFLSSPIPWDMLDSAILSNDNTIIVCDADTNINDLSFGLYTTKTTVSNLKPHLPTIATKGAKNEL